MPVKSSAEAASAQARAAIKRRHYGTEDPRTIAENELFAELSLRDTIRAALQSGHITPAARARLAAELLSQE